MSAMVRICKNRWMAYAIVGLLSHLSYYIGPSFSIKSADRIRNTVSFLEVKPGRLDTKESCIIPVAEAYEEGNFDHLAPTYHEDRNVVTLKGEEYGFDKEGDGDWNDDGFNETKLERFINSKGHKILRLTKISNGKVWAWSIQKNPSNKNDLINNYSLVDSDGIEGFDKKYGLEEDIPAPNHIKD